MTKILWVSKNKPLESQIRELKRHFGDDTKIDLDPNPFSSAYTIVNRYKNGGYDEMVLIAPLSICKLITELGYKPLYSEMVSASPKDYELAVRGIGDRVRGSSRYYKFVKFKRIQSIKITFSEL
jgi:hypothetical protein